MSGLLDNAKIRTITLLVLMIIWSVILVYDFNKNVHTAILIGDVFVLIIITVLFVISFRLPSSAVKTLQEVENEITEIESKQKTS